MFGEARAGEGAIDLHDIGDNVLARKKVLYDGHAVAAVAALTQELAREAAARIKVVYETLPPVMSIDVAIAPGAPILHEDMVTKGQPAEDGPTNIASRFELKRGDADTRIRRSRRRRRARVPHVDGPSGLHRAARLRCPVRSGRPRRGVVHDAGAVRGPRSVRGILGIDASQVKVIPTEIGGGFGGKIVVYLEPLAIALSKKAQRPVKMVMGRDEVFRATGPDVGQSYPREDRREARRHHRRGDRFVVVRGGGLPRIAGRRRGDVLRWRHIAFRIS